MHAKNPWLLSSAAALAVLAVAAPLSTSASARPQLQSRIAAAQRLAVVRHLESVRLLRGIASKQHETWKFERLMGKPRTPASKLARRTTSLSYRRWAYSLWVHRATVTRREALHPPHLSAWLCIHRLEASWTDDGAPYYGGLQMDLGFQTTYGQALLRRKGTANHWTPLEQMWVAERAYRSGRGFHPWPNTARWCGLI
jgi:hypothetical protein